MDRPDVIKLVGGPHDGYEVPAFTIGLVRFTVPECGCTYLGVLGGTCNLLTYVVRVPKEPVPEAFEKAFS